MFYKIKRVFLLLLILNISIYAVPEKNSHLNVEEIIREYKTVITDTNNAIKNCDLFFVKLSMEEIKKLLSKIDLYQLNKENHKDVKLNSIKDTLKKKYMKLDEIAGASENYKNEMNIKKIKS